MKKLNLFGLSKYLSIELLSAPKSFDRFSATFIKIVIEDVRYLFVVTLFLSIRDILLIISFFSQ